ncbi:MAG: hypothetical protein AAGC93_23895 [Cyanobacteria bacterium P01_F01_bin.53]
MTFFIFAITTIIQAFTVALGSRSINRFLAKHKSISSQRDLNAFKAIARNNMKGAAIILLVAPIGILCMLHLIISYGPIWLIPIFIVNIPMYIFSTKMKAIENKSRTLACEPHFQNEYARIGQTWLKKPWPNF